MEKRRVCVVITARPSYSRVKSLLRAMCANENLELQLVVAASSLLDKYGKVVDQIRQDGYTITAEVYNLVEGENLVTSAKTTGLGIIELSTLFVNLKPHLVVTIADRYETIATAIAASYMNIPLAHIQGGEVTGNIDEKVRHAVTKLADFHFVASQKAAERVIKMGEDPDSVYITGCPSIDIAREVVESHNKGDVIKKYSGVGNILTAETPYAVVMQHPVTTDIQSARFQIGETLKAVSRLPYQIYWFWPNVDAGSDDTSKGIRAFREKNNPQNIYFIKNMSPEDFLQFISKSIGIIGNSSVAIRECAFLGIPAINIGDRQDGRDRGMNVIDTVHDEGCIYEACLNHLKGEPKSDLLYGDGHAGERIAEIIAEVPLKFIKKLSY